MIRPTSLSPHSPSTRVIPFCLPLFFDCKKVTFVTFSFHPASALPLLTTPHKPASFYTNVCRVLKERTAFCYCAHARARLHKPRVLYESLYRIRRKKGREEREILVSRFCNFKENKKVRVGAMLHIFPRKSLFFFFCFLLLQKKI